MEPAAAGQPGEPIGPEQLERVALDGVGVLDRHRTLVVQVPIIDLRRGLRGGQRHQARQGEPQLHSVSVRRGESQSARAAWTERYGGGIGGWWDGFLSAR